MVRRHEEELDVKDEGADEIEADAKPRKRRTTTRLIHQDDDDALFTSVGVA
jgi:hypothetical protein